MTDQIPEEAVEVAAIALYNSNRDEEHADEFYDWPNIDSAYDWDGDADEEPAPEWARDRVRADVRVVLTAAYPYLRQQWESERRTNPAFIAHGHGVAHTDCWCARCESEAKAQLVARGEMTQLEAFCDFMHLCRDCGDKRCPRASDHRAACATRGAAQPEDSSHDR
jgi:hypothetical protein